MIYLVTIVPLLALKVHLFYRMIMMHKKIKKIIKDNA